MIATRKNMQPQPVIIKKYENRRLYDTTNSRYINQDEVAQMLREGYDVQVIDASTGEDLTRLVLTQIIVEQAKAPDSAFPLDILRQMVVASSRATQESTLKYMKAVLDMYQNAYRAMSPPMSPFEFIPGAGAVRPVSETAPNSRPAATVGASSATRTTPETQEVDELKRRLAELESLVRKPGSKKSKKRKTAARRKS
jgi:polyhydroxyalkanoate synthesis repressor PhaR